jgi:hypothetical protein
VLTSIGERLAPGEMDALLAEANPDAGGKIKWVFVCCADLKSRVQGWGGSVVSFGL